MRGFHDLMVEVDNDKLFASNKQAEMCNFLKKLGYDAAAFNVSVSAPLAKQHACQIQVNRIDRPSVSKMGVALGASASGSSARTLRQFTRVTISIDDHTHCHMVDPSGAILSGYDIVAVRPSSEKVFEMACKTLRIDIISLDMTRRLPFHLKQPLIKAALSRGIHFEITYAACLRDAGARKQVFGNAIELLRVTQGKNVILSSEAERMSELRAPNDVINLSSLFGLGHGVKGRRTLEENCAAVIKHALARRSGKAEARPLGSIGAGEEWAVPKPPVAEEDEDDGFIQLGGGDDSEEDEEEAEGSETEEPPPKRLRG